jgi:hypothetical protein
MANLSLSNEAVLLLLLERANEMAAFHNDQDCQHFKRATDDWFASKDLWDALKARLDVVERPPKPFPREKWIVVMDLDGFPIEKRAMGEYVCPPDACDPPPVPEPANPIGGRFPIANVEWYGVVQGSRHAIGTVYLVNPTGTYRRAEKPYMGGFATLQVWEKIA